MAIIGCLLSPALSLNAAREFKPGEVLPGSPGNGIVKSRAFEANELASGQMIDFSSKRSNKLSKEDEKTCEVKCVFKYDAERYQPYYVSMYNAEVDAEEYYDRENDYVCLYVAPGTYDIRTTYVRASETSIFREEGKAYLILEDIEVDGDMEVELDASLITETISFETYNPDGEKTALRYLRYLNENYDWEIITEYNVFDFYCDNYIIHKDYGTFSNHVNAGGVEIEPGPCGEWKSEWASNIYINQVSDKYQIAQLRMLYNEEECWVVPMFADGSKTQLVTNKGDKYSDLYDVKFAKSPLGEECEEVSDKPYRMDWGMRTMLNWTVSWGVLSGLSSFHHFRFCPTASSKLHPEYIYNMDFGGEDTAEIADIFRDYDEEGNLIYEEIRYATTGISTPTFILGVDSSEVYPGIDNHFLNLINEGRDYDNSLQSGVSYKVTPQNMPVFGSTPQFMRFYYQTYNSILYEYPYPMLTYNSLGYYGDSRSNGGDELKVSVNGNVVADSPEGLYEWQNECMESQMETGKLVFDYANTNIKIDGLAGCNTAKVCIDNAVENFTMPLIQSVQFRDSNDCVTEKFAYASTGRLIITGGDFREIKGDPNLVNGFGEQPMWYDIEHCDITVEYAPYGSNDFMAIEMGNEGEGVISFGYPYIGTLDSVDRCSETGWFDLRIVMTDAAGNTQEQIISPAFRVDSLAGIQAISVNGSNLRVLNSRVVSDDDMPVEVFTLSGQRVENEQLPAGLYVARSGKSVAKLMVK